jgi:hypothetical protein
MRSDVLIFQFDWIIQIYLFLIDIRLSQGRPLFEALSKNSEILQICKNSDILRVKRGYFWLILNNIQAHWPYLLRNGP